MSLATDENTGGVVAGIAARFGEDDERRWELIEWMERNGFGSTPWRSIPPEVVERARRELGHATAGTSRAVVKTFVREAERASNEVEKPATPARPAGGETMRTCGSCGSKEHDRRTCPKEASVEKPAKESTLPSAKPGRAPSKAHAQALEAMGIDELVAERERCDARVSEINAELRIRRAALAKALGEAA